jgi:hypothetical protein
MRILSIILVVWVCTSAIVFRAQDKKIEDLETRIVVLEKAEKSIEIHIDREIMDDYKLGEDMNNYEYSLDKEMK